jgi:hypothetical protein
MAETLVKPEDLTDLVRSDAFTTLASQTLAIRSHIRDDAIETLRILKVKRHIEEFTDVDVEHVALRVNNSLMQKNSLQINAWTAWDLERNLKALEAEDGDTNEGIWGAVKNSYLTYDWAKVREVRRAFSLAITELDPLGNFPSMSCETEVSNSRRVCDRKIAATVNGPIVFE